MFSKNKIDTDPKKINDILERSVSKIYPSKEELRKKLLSGERLVIYSGADATGGELHLGHSTNFILLEKLRKLGHQIIVLFGDFTAQIGDPTDKGGSTRKMLTKKDVNKNLKTWEKQISNILKIKDSKNPVKIVRNSKWLSKLSFEDVINLSSNFTVQQMIERDMFQERLKNKKPIYMHEFFYPLMQGYDSVVLNCDLEIGGNDQTFNMLAGRTLLRKIKNKEKFVLTTTLLENPNTKEKLMSKSKGDYISMEDNPEEMFGKVMALPDEVIIPMFIDTTLFSLNETDKIKINLLSGELNPRDAKVKLAKEIIKIYHSEKAAEMAAENFEKTFKEGGVPDNVIEISKKEGDRLDEILLDEKIISSKNEWRRLIDQNGLTIVGSGEKISDLNYLITETNTYRVGKKRFIKVVV